MTKREKLIQKILEGKKISFEDADKILQLLGYLPEAPKSGSSHITYRLKDKNPITLVRNRKELKTYQVKMIQEALK